MQNMRSYKILLRQKEFFQTTFSQNESSDIFIFYFQIQQTFEMGRAARNHGGTGGHGYFPLPGERPNYNHHVIQDNVLFNTVKNNVKKQGESTKLKIVKQRSKEEILSTRQSAHCQKEFFFSGQAKRQRQAVCKVQRSSRRSELEESKAAQHHQIQREISR